MKPLLRFRMALIGIAKAPVWSWMQFLIIVVLASYVYIAMQIRYANAEEILKLRTEVERLERTYAALSDSLQLRIQALESTTYVDVLSELKKRPARSYLEAWQKNRDADVNRRLDALERWRYSIPETK